MRYAAKHGKNLPNTLNAIRAREDFNAGNLWASRTLRGVGIMPEPYRADFYARANRIEYVVYSYSTPIAWFDSTEGWYVPVARYSRSTGWHQSNVETALGGYYLTGLKPIDYRSTH